MIADDRLNAQAQAQAQVQPDIQAHAHAQPDIQAHAHAHAQVQAHTDQPTDQPAVKPEPLKLSNPCPERCPKCRDKCFGARGHARIATAGKGYANPHQCRCGLNWATGAEWCEIMRAEARATRLECGEAVKKCHKCSEAIKRLGT